MAAPSPNLKEEMSEPDDGLEPAPTASPRRAGFAVFRRVFSRFASAFLILFLLLAAVYALSPAFRQKSAEIIAKADSREFRMEPAAEAAPEEIQGRNPRWLPAGTWELTFDVHDVNIAQKTYTRPDGATIQITELGPGMVLSIDTEDAEVREDIIVKGHSSVLSVKEAQIILVWEDGEAQRYYMVSIVGAPELTDPAVILRIAENLD